MVKIVKIKARYKTWDIDHYVYRTKVVNIERQLDAHGFIKGKAERNLVDIWLSENISNYAGVISYENI